MSFEDRPYLREIQLKRDNISDFESYPFSIPAVKELDHLEFHPDVTFFVGENGTGKSTLIEAIAVSQGFNPEEGRRIQLSRPAVRIQSCTNSSSR